MARRPWKDKPDPLEQKTPAKLVNMNHTKIKRMSRMVHDAMDTTCRSIALKNVKLCLKTRKDVVWMRIVIKAPAMGEEKSKGKRLAWLKGWSNWWETKKQVLIVPDAQVAERAPRSVSSILENANKRGYETIDQHT